MKRTALKRISKKRGIILIAERTLMTKLLIKQAGLCADCGKGPDWRGLSKHELVPRSRGGDPIDENNCILLCGKCHSTRHGLEEVSQ